MPGPHRNRERSPTSSPGGSPSPVTPPRAEVAASAVVPEPAPAEGGDPRQLQTPAFDGGGASRA